MRSYSTLIFCAKASGPVNARQRKQTEEEVQENMLVGDAAYTKDAGNLREVQNVWARSGG